MMKYVKDCSFHLEPEVLISKMITAFYLFFDANVVLSTFNNIKKKARII